LRANLTAQKPVPKSARVKERNEKIIREYIDKVGYVLTIIIIQFNFCLFKCKLKGSGANYKVSMSTVRETAKIGK
jgi:hypothetical protein